MRALLEECVGRKHILYINGSPVIPESILVQGTAYIWKCIDITVSEISYDSFVIERIFEHPAIKKSEHHIICIVFEFCVDREDIERGCLSDNPDIHRPPWQGIYRSSFIEIEHSHVCPQKETKKPYQIKEVFFDFRIKTHKK
jgi:hypothetical protein